MIRRRAAVAALTLASVLTAACAGTAEEPRASREALLLGEFLDASPAACGLRGPAPTTRPVERASTVRAQVDAVAAVVARIRGFDSPASIRPTFVSRREFEARLARLVRRELAERDLEAAERALRTLGAIPRAFELETAIAALGRSAGGLYDEQRKQILVARTGVRRLAANELEVLAHEIEHALSDARLGLPHGARSDRWGDTHLAAAALAEGSATLTEFRFLAALAGWQLVALALQAPADDVFALPSLPYVIEQSFVFPYLEGIGFVCALYRRGGWTAVDRAFERPPLSSAQILFPERYLARELPRQPEPLGRLPAPWKQGRFAGTFGAADLLWLFRAPRNDEGRALDGALDRARAWAGGRIEIWSSGADTAVGIALVQRRGSTRLCSSIGRWYQRAFPDAARSGAADRLSFRGGGQAAALICRGNQVRLGIAPTVPLARRLAR